MCRMILAIGNFDSSIVVNGLRQMSKDQTKKHEYNKGEVGSWCHTDGWGAAYTDTESQWIISRSINDITNDRSLSKLTDTPTNCLVMHARKGTIGSVQKENTHPFSTVYQEKKYLLFHNGSVRDTINYSSEFSTQGGTDSEKLLFAILTKAKEVGIAKAMFEILQSAKDTEGNNLILVAENTIYVATGSYVMPNYYTMSKLQREDSLIISSEALENIANEGEWESIPENAVFAIDVNSREITRVI